MILKLNNCRTFCICA